MSGGDLFQVIGGSAGCRRLAEAFYAGVKHDSVLRRFFPGKSMTCAIEAFSAFLVQFLGGPSDDACRRYWVSLQESHLRFRIGRRERNAWMQQMVRALNEADIAEPARQTLRTFFEHSSAYLVNQGQAPEVSGVPQEIAPNWDRQRALDEAVAAVRRGASGDAIARAEAIQCEPSRRSGLMALMIASGDDAMLQWVEKKVRTDPTLVTARYNGRTLLHAAAAAGQTTIVRALLQLGADANAVDAGGHPPLYSVANECRQGGADVVLALVEAGAQVNACGGVQRCTPLHMAARRGNIEIVRALIECGANIHAKDKRGDTPRDRALNCRKPEVAALLRSP